MIRRAFRIAGPLALVLFFVYFASFLGLGYVIGYVLLAWVLWRAAPGCWADARMVFGLASSALPRRFDARRSPNNGF